MMRSLFLAVLAAGAMRGSHLHLGGSPLKMDTSFGRPRDPVMDQVANILQGILSNLTKHPVRLTEIAQEVAKANSKEDVAKVIGNLEHQLSKLNKGGDSYVLDAFVAEHPTEAKQAPALFKKSLMSVVTELKAHVA